ncbi:MAG: GGDEF domain-containing protein [Lachnospiraceae bacterium]|nr:GGDEF domain-containing protein [Lachnospiraceae bacterium]
MPDKIKQLLFPPNFHELRVDFNRDNARTLSFVLYSGLAISAVMLAIGNTVGQGSVIRYRAMAFFLFFAISAGARFSYREDIDRHATVFLYIWSALLLGVCLIHCTICPPDHPTFLYLFFFMLIPLLIRDAPGRILIFTVCGALAFILVDVRYRTSAAFRFDMVHLAMVIIVNVYMIKRTLVERISYMTTTVNAETKAEHDVLTGIYNRRGGENLIRECLANETAGAYLIIDVDNFKHVNDEYGHGHGDYILKQVAKVLQHSFRETDIVMRMGGDEFIVYAVGMADINHVEAKLAQLREDVHTIMIDEEKNDHVTTSVGCIVNLGSYDDYDKLYEAADRLLYIVKSHGKDGYRCSDKDCS